jgi:predicted ArsR family transcriptional regulator
MTVATIRDRIMETLVYNGPMTRAEIADELQVHVGILGSAIDLLAQEGLIEAEQSTRSKKLMAVRHG